MADDFHKVLDGFYFHLLWEYWLLLFLNNWILDDWLLVLFLNTIGIPAHNIASIDILVVDAKEWTLCMAFNPIWSLREL